MSVPFRPIALLAFSVPFLGAAPLPLKYTAYLGDGARISAVAVDASGSAYVTGSATAALPTTPSAFQTAFHSSTCTDPSLPTHPFPCPVAFAAKLTPDGTALAYLTYLGASNSSGANISVDAQGDAWISGTVASADLPVTAGALSATPKSGGTAFVVKLNPSGSQALYASYLNGPNAVSAQALDGAGSLYLAGNVASAASIDLPVTSGAFQTDPGQVNGPPGFVAKFDPAGRLLYATYFHGTSYRPPLIAAIAADAAGSAYVTGYDDGSLPTTPGAFRTIGYGVFAAKLDPTGSKLLYCTYLGASVLASPTQGSAIAVDAQGNSYVAGVIFNYALDYPGSPTSFPVTPGAFQTTPPVPPIVEDGYVGFLLKLNAIGSAPVYATYISGSSNTRVTAMAVDTAGSAMMLGFTAAPDFPTTPGALFQCGSAGISSFTNFVLELSPDGSQAVYSTYLEAGLSATLALDSAGQMYLTGYRSAEPVLPVVPGSFGWTAPSGSFVAALAPHPLPAGSVSCAVSAASHRATEATAVLGSRPVIAPGELVDILGIGIGPAQAITSSAVSGRVPTSLGGVQVLFGGFPAPLLSAGPNRIRAIIPFEAAGPSPYGLTPLTVQIENTLVAVEPFAMWLAPAVPAIFAADGDALRALVINENGKLNSFENPAAEGSIATIYATGLNNTVPPLADGAIATAAAPLALATYLKFGVEVTYAGAAPGLVAGVTQINFRVPHPGPGAPGLAGASSAVVSLVYSDAFSNSFQSYLTFYVKASGDSR